MVQESFCRLGQTPVFHRLTAEFAEKHPGPDGDKIYTQWMITRMRQAFPRGK